MDVLDFVIISGAASGAALLFKTQLLETAANLGGAALASIGRRINDPERGWKNLAEHLPHQDFNQYDVETYVKNERTYYSWIGLEITPISSDAFSNGNWNWLGQKLHLCLSSLEKDTVVQTMMRIRKAEPELDGLYKGQYEDAAQRKNPLRAVVASRYTHLSNHLKAGKYRNWSYYVFIGRPIPEKGGRRLQNFLGRAVENVTRQEINALLQDLKQTAKTFIANYTAVGGSARVMTVREVYEQLYVDLNPERAATIACPKQVIFEDEISPSQALFIESPRETLCFTDLQAESGIYQQGNMYRGILSLKQFPSSYYAGLLEPLAYEGLKGEATITTSFRVLDSRKEVEGFEAAAGRLDVDVAQDGIRTDFQKIKQSEELKTLQADLLSGNEKIGLTTFQVSLLNSNVVRLQADLRAVSDAARQIQGMEVIAENRQPMAEFMNGLPCGSGQSVREKKSLSSQAIGLMPLTGPPKGFPWTETKIVMTMPHGGLYGWNPSSTRFANRSSVWIGGSRSGKSAGLNLQRAHLLAQDYQGVTVDFRSSSKRLACAVDGKYIDIADPKISGFGLFAIKPMEGEEFEPDDLSRETGVPLERLAMVQMVLELLCLDPRSNQQSLKPRDKSVLDDAVHRTYEEYRYATGSPVLEDFIKVLKNAQSDDKIIALDLAARLSVYGGDKLYARFLNDRSGVARFDYRYIIFDLDRVMDNPYLMLICTLAINNYLARWLRKDRRIKKFVDIDELQKIKGSQAMCRVIDEIVRTAAKLNAQISVASQAPTDFRGNGLEGIAASVETKWIFHTPLIQEAVEIFNLGPGAAEEIAKIRLDATAPYRDCVLFPGSFQPARLRIEMSPLERRLCTGGLGGNEAVSYEAALADLQKHSRQPSKSMLEAIQLDALDVE